VQIVFPIPEICEYLTEETKTKLFYNAERDDQGSKVSLLYDIYPLILHYSDKVTDFFERSDDCFAEMKWQKRLRANAPLFWVSSHMSFWSYVIFVFSVFINVIVATFYPFTEALPSNKMLVKHLFTFYS